MARLTNVNTGAIVEVRDEKVEAMGAEWQPAKVEAMGAEWQPAKAETKAPAKKSASSKSSK